MKQYNIKIIKYSNIVYKDKILLQLIYNIRMQKMSSFGVLFLFQLIIFVLENFSKIPKINDFIHAVHFCIALLSM